MRDGSREREREREREPTKHFFIFLVLDTRATTKVAKKEREETHRL